MKGDTIPNGEFLFKYAKPTSFPPDQIGIPFGIFLGDPEMSCDWEKFQKRPETSFHINEGRTVIVQIEVCDEIKNPTNPKRAGQFVPDWKQEILHDPVSKDEDLRHPEGNYSHSLIKGLKKQPVAKIIAEKSSIYKPRELHTFENKTEDIQIPIATIIITTILLIIVLLMISNFFFG